VVKEREGGIVRRVQLLDAYGDPIVVVSRFLDHLVERAGSPHTLCAYGYDLQQLFTFLASEQLAWQAFEPADALRFLTFLRRREQSGRLVELVGAYRRANRSHTLRKPA